MTLGIFITWAFIAGTINVGIAIYFIFSMKPKMNKIIEYLSLRYPDKIGALIGNDKSLEAKQSSEVRIKIGKFIRNNEFIQDIEYTQLRKEFLSSSRVFQLTLSIVCLIESLFVIVPIFLFKQTPTDQAVVREVPLVVFYGLSSFFWFVYQLYKGK